MTTSELKGFVMDEENGLSKEMRLDGRIQITYWPKQLLFKNNSGEVNALELDDVDYFMVRCISCTEGYLGQQTISLMVNDNEISLLDVLRLPQSGTTVRNYSVLYAFRSNLSAGAVSDKITFIVSKGAARNAVVFSNENIKMIQEINIVQ